MGTKVVKRHHVRFLVGLKKGKRVIVGSHPARRTNKKPLRDYLAY